MRIVFGLFVGTLLVVALAAAGAAHEVGPPNLAFAFQDSSQGAAVYQAKCASCHQADGSGVSGAFPPLAGNPRAAEAAYVESVVTGGLSGPIEVLGLTYNSVMPAIELGSDEVAAVVAYVGTLAAGGGDPTPTTTARPASADAANGKKLFKGTIGFAEGGAACAACHSAGDIGFRGGSGLGPDLSDVYDRLGGDAGLAAWLSSPASQTMQPLFDDKPLTTAEIADLSAFLATTTDATAGGGVDLLLVGGGIGLLVLLGLMALIIQGPNETYNQRLRRRQ
jgi:mono/diheme cytochrome c family protein